jgi:26S proteasome regulatory subunit N5
MIICVQAVQAFVKQGMSYINLTPDLETKVELIKTLQSVTEGKVRYTMSRQYVSVQFVPLL